MVSEDQRLMIVKRYFHDIRNGYTLWDDCIVRQFKDNPYDNFIRYRYCIETPTDPVVLTVPLICDSLITLYNSKGQTFQTFDGILDFSMKRCDTVHPNVDFKLDRLIPLCNHGAVYNSNHFKGFIDYSVIRKLDDSLLTDERLNKCIKDWLDIYGTRMVYHICKFDDSKELSENIFNKCSKNRRVLIYRGNRKEEIPFKLNCFLTKDDKWVVLSRDVKKICVFFKDQFQIQASQEKFIITLSMISLKKLRKYISKLPSKFTQLPKDEFLVTSYEKYEKTLDIYFVEHFSKMLRVRFFPKKGAIVGIEFDVFGIWNNIKSRFLGEGNPDPQSEIYKKALDQFMELEAAEVRKRTIHSLEKELNMKINDKQFFEVPYNPIILSKILHRFYFIESFKDDDKIVSNEFLTSLRFSKHFKPFYCAPQLSEENNPAIDLPYFWCRGKECFRNNLYNQTLAEEQDWKKYSLYHLVEIIGFPKLHKTVGGYEPDSSLRQFIALTNKVKQKFNRLKCRSCGHMMFSYKNSVFNRYNYYACVNPTCSEVSKPVYLNFCYSCKKGLIDSRDTKRCPNGWYICPTCLSCCNDEQYERLAQRYIVINRSVPKWIESRRGHGHNDKGKYFCPKCGGLMIKGKDEYGKPCHICTKCHTHYNLT